MRKARKTRIDGRLKRSSAKLEKLRGEVQRDLEWMEALLSAVVTASEVQAEVMRLIRSR